MFQPLGLGANIAVVNETPGVCFCGVYIPAGKVASECTVNYSSKCNKEETLDDLTVCYRHLTLVLEQLMQNSET